MPTWFLVAAFFFPRLTLITCWILGAMPANDTPLAADIIAAIVAPRLLIAWWVYVSGGHPVLVAFFAFGGLIELLSGGRRATRRKES
jgi:hypothetical protein